MTTKLTSKTTTPNRRISITASDYNQKMDKIIAKANDSGWDIDQTLIALLDEANKYVIKSTPATNSKKAAKMHYNKPNVKVRKNKKDKHEDGIPKAPKRVRK